VDPRYDGQPFLRLIELYAIAKLGALTELDAERLRQMTPRLQTLYGRQGTWMEIVAAEMDFDSAVDESIKANWARWCEKGGGEEFEAFARAFADAIIR